MEPLVIVILTFACIALMFLVIQWSFDILDAINLYMKTKRSPVISLLIIVPWIVLAVWCAILYVIGLLISMFIGYEVLKGIRNWWHKS